MNPKNQKEKIPKESVTEFRKEVRKARWIMWMRVWWGSVAFTAGIMLLVVGGLFAEVFNINVWWVSGFAGACLIACGFYLIATC